MRVRPVFLDLLLPNRAFRRRVRRLDRRARRRFWILRLALAAAVLLLLWTFGGRQHPTLP